MPRHVSLVVDRHLVGVAVPGTRVCVTGISMIYQSSSAKSMGDVAIRHPYIKVVGLQVDNEGAGRVSSNFTPQEVAEFKAIARRLDIYDIITKVMQKYQTTCLFY